MAAPPGGQYPTMISQASVIPYSTAMNPLQPPQQMHHQPQQMVSPTREINAITLCKKGQECVQDVVQKAVEIFKLFQSKTLPVSM